MRLRGGNWREGADRKVQIDFQPRGDRALKYTPLWALNYMARREERKEFGVKRLPWWTLWCPNPHWRYDPRGYIWRIAHRLRGPRWGCSCTRCFNDPRRLMLAEQAIDRFVRLERRVEDLERERRRQGPVSRQSVEGGW